jgi:hypothetical protein
MVRVCALSALIAVALAAPARAGQMPYGWDAGMTQDARPTLFLDASWNGSTLAAVLRCPGGGACVAPLGVTPGGTVDMSAVQAGDVIEVRYADGQARRTPPWRGAPQVARLPRMTGRLVVGARARAERAAWTDAGWAWGFPGGWRNNQLIGLAACRTSSGRDCLRISYAESVELERAWARRYVFAMSSLSFWDGYVSQIAAAPYPIADLKPGPLRAIAGPFGRIAPRKRSGRA